MRLLFLLLFPFLADAQIYGMGQKAHPDYLALLAEAVSDGATIPSYTQRVKHNALVRNWDSKDGIWETKDIVYVFLNDGSEAFSLYNWRNPASAPIVESGTVTWTSNAGSQGNGTNGYYATAYVGGGANLYQQNSASITIDVIQKATTASSSYLGKTTPTTNYSLVNLAGGARLNCNSTATVASPTSFVNSFVSWHRDNSADVDVWVDGVFDRTVTQASSAISIVSFDLFRNNGAAFYSDAIIGMISFGAHNTGIAGEYESWNIYASNP